MVMWITTKEHEHKFLYLPKKIDGKWYWLRSVIIVREKCVQTIGGEEVEYIMSEQYIIGGDSRE